jgi:uncharacterized repeat protein (TIGR03803 family)
MTQIAIGKRLMDRLSFVLPLLALGFTATIALAQSDDIEAASPKFTTLHAFTGTDGTYPQPGLVQGTNGDFYGSTLSNCQPGVCGTIFKVSAGGAFTTIYSFCPQGGCTDAPGPFAGLLQATNRDLYGMTPTIGNGANCTGGACGSIFKMTLSGALTTLYTFCSPSGCPNGWGPSGGLVEATNGDLYGTTSFGGAYDNGMVFKITPGGALTTLYSFCSKGGCADGANPGGTLVQATNGDLYGTTVEGGVYDAACQCYGGTIFKITSAGTLTTLHRFCTQSGCPEGYNPAGLVQGTNGDFYGTTVDGGAGAKCPSTQGCGTIFRITPSGGTLTTLYRFCSQPACADGGNSQAPLVQAANGNLFGTTESGGTNGAGTIFKMTPSGTLVTLYNFCEQAGCPDGAGPVTLVQGTNGIFYGTAAGGGIYSLGTVFSFSTGQPSFLETRPTSGEVGKTVTILGYKLTGATSVTFNGTPAAFTVESATQISTTVPAGATTGKVEVITPEGTLSSNVPFRVP